MDDALRYATAAELRDWYLTGAVSPTGYTRGVLDLLYRSEPTLHAFLTVTAELALAQAAAAERLILSLGPRAWADRPLLGLPISVKDLIHTAGIRTTRGSRQHATWVPGRDAPSVARLRRAGAILIGKTNTSEYGWSAGTVNGLSPPTANPWDPARSAGGSSGGAAAAVAAGIGVGALGTDGAGSVRIPAAFCGVVGFKPTFGRVPYVPVSPEGLSHVGPLTRDVDTAALIAGVIAGPHPADPFSVDAGRRWTAGVDAESPGEEGGYAGARADRGTPARALRIGWLRWDGTADASGRAGHPGHPAAGIEAVARAAAEVLGEVIDVDSAFPDPYPHLVTILAAFDAAGQAPEADALSDPHRNRVVAHGRRLRAVDLARAQAGRLLLAGQVGALMERFDLLAMPTASVEPFAVDAWQPASTPDPDLGWLAWCRATYPFNLTGQPAVSVPAGFTSAGLPVGLQLVGRWHADDLVLRAAGEVERVRPWRQHYPRKDRP